MKRFHLFSQSAKKPGTLDPWSMILPVTFDLVCGLLLILLGNLALRVTSYAVSGLMIACAAWLIIAYIRSTTMEKITGFRLAGGLALLVSGVLLAFSPDYLDKFLPFVWGLALLFGGFMKIQYAFDEKLLGISKWWILLIFSAFSLAIGVVCLASPDFLANSPLIIGIMLVVEAVLDLTVFILMNQALKKNLPDGSPSPVAEQHIIEAPVTSDTAAAPAAPEAPESTDAES